MRIARIIGRYTRYCRSFSPLLPLPGPFPRASSSTPPSFAIIKMIVEHPPKLCLCAAHLESSSCWQSTSQPTNLRIRICTRLFLTTTDTKITSASGLWTRWTFWTESESSISSTESESGSNFSFFLILKKMKPNSRHNKHLMREKATDFNPVNKSRLYNCQKTFTGRNIRLFRHQNSEKYWTFVTIQHIL